MTLDQMNDFPYLWEGFAQKFRYGVIKILTPRMISDPGAFRGVLSKVYDSIGWDYWRKSESEAAQWMQLYEERFFDNKYYTFKKLLYYFKEIDILVEESLKQIPKLSKLRIGLYANKLYESVIEPHLEARREEVMKAWEDLKKELSEPVQYVMPLPLEEPGKVTLQFSSVYRKHHFYASLENYAYSFNGRSHRGVDTLWEKTLEELSEDAFIGEDIYGERVLKVYTAIPTFDYADREWDSRVLEYLIFDGKDVHLVVMRGGYNIASLTFYEKLLWADEGMKFLLEELKWPITL